MPRLPLLEELLEPAVVDVVLLPLGVEAMLDGRAELPVWRARGGKVACTISTATGPREPASRRSRRDLHGELQRAGRVRVRVLKRFTMDCLFQMKR